MIIDPLVHETNILRACLIFNQNMSFLSIEMSALVNLQSDDFIMLKRACITLVLGAS